MGPGWGKWKHQPNRLWGWVPQDPKSAVWILMSKRGSPDNLVVTSVYLLHWSPVVGVSPCTTIQWSWIKDRLVSAVNAGTGDWMVPGQFGAALGRLPSTWAPLGHPSWDTEWGVYWMMAVALVCTGASLPNRQLPISPMLDGRGVRCPSARVPACRGGSQEEIPVSRWTGDHLGPLHPCIVEGGSTVPLGDRSRGIGG